MNKNFCKLMSDTKPKIQEAQRIASRINAKLCLRLSQSNRQNSKIQKKNLERSQGKTTLYLHSTKIRNMSYFSENMEARTECSKTHKVLKETKQNTNLEFRTL